MKNSIWIKLAYGIGQFGWSLASFGVGSLLNYFYMPPESNKEALFPNFIHQGFVIGFFTIIGLISFSGRFFDGIWDTYVAQLSDKSKSPIGKRKFFMIIGIVPFAISSFFIFYPIFQTSPHNTLWLIFNTIIFYISMTLYVVPYTALMSELAYDKKDLLLISTIISITWAAGTVLGNCIYAIQDHLSNHMSHLHAFQLTIAGFTVLAFISMMFPILFINEEKHCAVHEEKHNDGFLQNVKKLFLNSDFKNFILADLAYWIAVSTIQIGMVYYITVLLKLDLSKVTIIFTSIYLLSFALYIPINIIARKFGNRKTQIVSFFMTIVVYILISALGKIPCCSPIVQISIIGIIIAFPLATFGIIPNAIVAEIIEINYKRTGQRNAAMYYAARSFMMKCGISIANLVFPTIILLGKTTENDIGIRISAIFSACILFSGLYFFRKYKGEDT